MDIKSIYGKKMEVLSDRFVSFIQAAKYKDKEECEHLVEAGNNPKYGFCWFHNKPTFVRTALGWDLKFLIFIISYDDFRKMSNEVRRTPSHVGELVSLQSEV